MRTASQVGEKTAPSETMASGRRDGRTCICATTPVGLFRRGRTRRGFVVALAVFAAAAHAQVGSGGKLRNFRFPDYYPPASPAITNPVLKTLLSGAEAQQLPGGQVQIHGLRIESFREDGRRELEVRAAECVFDVAARVASGPARLEVNSADGLYSIRGEGFLWRQSDGLLVISNRALTVLNRRLLAGRGAPAATNVLTADPEVRASSDRAEFHSQSNAILHAGHVKVEDVEMELECGALRVQFTPAKRLQEIVAEQGVVLVNVHDQSRTSGEGGLYVIGPDRESLTLTGQPVWRDQSGRQEVRAEVFDYDLRERRVRATGGATMRLPRGRFLQPLSFGEAAPGGSDAETNSIHITARALTLLLPGTNRLHRSAVAETNVLIHSPADRSRATADRALFNEAGGTIELLGRAQWEGPNRQVHADVLTMNPAHRSFAGRGHVRFRLPLSEVGPRSPAAGAGPAAAFTNLVLEVQAQEMVFQTNHLVFLGRVQARVLDGPAVRGQATCERLTARFTDRLESVLAEQRVLAEHYPARNAPARSVTNLLSCGVLSARLSEAADVIALVAMENVQAAQVDVRTNRRPVVTELTCGSLTAVALTRAGQVDKLQAERHVVISQGDKQARGERALYTAEANTFELTGSPQAAFAGGRVKDAEALIWDRTTGTFHGRGKYRIELDRAKPPGGTNRTGLFLWPP